MMKIEDIVFNCEIEDIINKLKTQVDYFEKMKSSGDNLMVQCPYHSGGKEKRPSAGFRKSDGIFHCFACGETHTLPEVISYCLGYDDKGLHGWTWLLKNFISIEKEERQDVRLDLECDSNNGIDDIDVTHSRRIITGDHSRSINYQGNSINYVGEEELDSYRYIHPYMYKRKLTDDIIEKFDIGYDAATESITFPVRDIRGNCLFVARRSVKLKWFNYPKNVEKPLYGLYELYADPLFMPSEVIVCESMLDALTCWVYGKYAVAMNGLGTELQFKQLRELPCRKLILATDNDEAGMKARKVLRQHVKNKIITEYILPEGRKDINELSKDEFDNLEEVF